MAKLILHVGMPKTGSSFIQGVLNKNHRIIEDNYSIRFLGGIAPHALACHLISDENLISRSDINNLKGKYTSEIKELLNKKASNSELVFISSEYFVLCDINGIIDYFSPIFESIEVVVTVRRQDKLIASGYNQDVKALGRISNLTWSAQSSNIMNYWEYCEGWDSKGIPVVAIDYDLVKKEKSGLLRAFMKILNVDYSSIESQFIKPDNSSSNYSLNHNEVILKLACNRIGLSETKAQKLIEEFNDSLSGEFTLPKVYEKVIASSYKASNKKFISKYLSGCTVSELHFDNFDDVTNKEMFSWDPLGPAGEVIKFILKKIESEK